MNRYLNTFTYMYSYYLMIYVYFLYDFIHIPLLKVFLSSCMVGIGIIYSLKKITQEKKRLFLLVLLPLLVTLLNYQGLMSLCISIYYYVLEILLYFFILKDKEIETRHLWIPLALGFFVSMYVYEFKMTFIEEGMFAYFLIYLCCVSSGNLEVYYLNHETKEKKLVDRILVFLMVLISLFSNTMFTFIVGFISFVLRYFLLLISFILNSCIEVIGTVVGAIMMLLFSESGGLDIKIEVSEAILGDFIPGEVQNVDGLKLIFYAIVLVAIILILRFIYQKYKENNSSVQLKKELKAYYQEVEDLKHDSFSIFNLFKKENLTKLRKKYKKEVKRRIKEGYPFASYFTTSDYLNTLKDASLKELTLEYQKERYGRYERD